MPEGVQYPDIIDKVVCERDGSVALVMREDRPWDGSEERIAELRKKINNYVIFALEGQMAKEFPDLAGKPVHLRLMCIQHQPNADLKRILDGVNTRLAQYSLELRVLVIMVDDPEEKREKRRRNGKPWWKIW